MSVSTKVEVVKTVEELEVELRVEEVKLIVEEKWLEVKEASAKRITDTKLSVLNWLVGKIEAKSVDTKIVETQQQRIERIKRELAELRSSK